MTSLKSRELVVTVNNRMMPKWLIYDVRKEGDKSKRPMIMGNIKDLMKSIERHINDHTFVDGLMKNMDIPREK